MTPTHTSAPLPFSLTQLHAMLNDHPASKAPLLRCLSAGWAAPHDLQFVLPVIEAAQRARLACFTLLAGRAAGVDPADGDLLWRWQQAEPEPAQALPTFALYFTQQCIHYCRTAGLGEAAAFLLVTDALAMRLHAALSEAHQKNTPDAPATAIISATPVAAIEELVLLCAQPGTGDGADLNATGHALALHLRLFSDLYQGMRQARLVPLSDRIQARLSLELDEEPALPMYPGVGEIMCVEQDDKRRIEFTVERYPCTAEVLDPRVVRIPPGKTNNLHKHAHETLFYFISGTGRILVGDRWVNVKPGDAVFAPRWAMHQTDNTGNVTLVLLAITDYYLTSSTYVGKYEKI